MIMGPFLKCLSKCWKPEHFQGIIQLAVLTDWIIDTLYCVSIFCLPDTTWCHCTWRDSQAFTFHILLLEAVKKAKTHSSPTFFFKRSVQHDGFLLLSVDCLIPLTLFFTFFTSSPNGVLLAMWTTCSRLKIKTIATLLCPHVILCQLSKEVRLRSSTGSVAIAFLKSHKTEL